MNANDAPERYALQSHLYLENALLFFERGDTEKASEFFWGSLAQALKTVAVTRSIELRTHRHIREYARSLAKELEDEDFFTVFRDAEGLHSNFYESDLQADDVYIVGRRVGAMVNRLLGLIQPPPE